jgi:hypothetical protein
VTLKQNGSLCLHYNILKKNLSIFQQLRGTFPDLQADIYKMIGLLLTLTLSHMYGIENNITIISKT